MADAPSFGVETIGLDLPAVAGGFGRRLHDAGVPCSPERSERFARGLSLVRPISRRRLYWTARAVFVSDPGQVRAFDGVFAAVFGSGAAGGAVLDDEVLRTTTSDPASGSGEERAGRPGDDAQDGPQLDAVPSPTRDPDAAAPEQEVPVGLVPSDEELLRGKRFDTLSPEELAALYRLMSALEIAPPERRTRRARRDHHGPHVDLRRTLRGSLRTGGDPVHLARRRRRIVRRRLVLLCDISGSMEPYARAYLQFLTCAAGGGPGNSEAFVFATRLTRLTRALASRNPERAIQRAAAAAPDWSSGTRIGEALKTFNDRHGRRGMARGAVIVILSDGWERGDPSLVAREMERLSRLAHRIVWVNPRVAAAGFSPRTGGMAAALPFCDALVSGHTLDALHEVVEAIGGGGPAVPAWAAPTLEPEPEEEPWASATPLPGSSVAMPSGYGPRRGNTTPGWGQWPMK